MADEAEQMFSTSERVATGYLITLVLVLGGGSVLLPGPIVDAFLDPYVLDPIVKRTQAWRGMNPTTT